MLFKWEHRCGTGVGLSCFKETLLPPRFKGCWRQTCDVEINVCVWHVSCFWLVHQTLQEPLWGFTPAGRVSWSRGPRVWVHLWVTSFHFLLICLKIWTVMIKTLIMFCWKVVCILEQTGSVVFQGSWFCNHWLASYVMVSLSLSFSSCLSSWLLPFPCALSVCWWLVSLHWFHVHLLECWPFLYSIFSLHLLSTWCVPVKLDEQRERVRCVLRCDRKENA